MIPKIIHYCWLSNDPVPENLQKCMDSWKRYLPDYEFMLWNFDRFDKKSSLWVEQAFDNRKYAFAADYIRLFAIYNYGGIYLDMDVDGLRDVSDSEWVGTLSDEGENMKLEPRRVDYSTVPNVRGMGLRDALYVLENSGLKVGVAGAGMVRKQSLQPGSEVPKGSYVQIELR